MVTEELGGLGYVCFDVADVVRGWFLSPNFAQIDVQPYREYLATLAANRRPLPTAPRPRKQVIYLQMESVDGFMVNASYRGEPVMPFLARLAAEQVYFANAIDNTGCGRTTDAEILTLTSLVPLHRAPIYVSQPLERVPSIPKILEAAGYDTWSMHGFEGSFWNRAVAHRALGYRHSYFEDQLVHDDRLGWGIPDHSVLHQAAQRLLAAKQPTFAHVILLTNHHPFSAVREHDNLPDQGMLDDYILSLRYTDRCLEAFFAELREGGLLENCIIGIYGDHDSSQTSQFAAQMQYPLSPTCGDSVPLIVCGLDEAPLRVEAVGGLQDLPVMVLDALGLPVPCTFTGNSLGHNGSTIGFSHGLTLSTPDGVVQKSPPVDLDILTQLALKHPERLLEP